MTTTATLPKPKARTPEAAPLRADRCIWRFPLPNLATGTLSAPKGSTFLTAELTPKGIQLWAEVTPGEPEVSIRFALLPTSLQPIPKGFQYLKTLMVPGGNIFHVYLDRRTV